MKNLKHNLHLLEKGAFHFKIERQGSPLSFTSVSTVLDFLAKTRNEKKKKSGSELEGKEQKLPPLFA